VVEAEGCSIGVFNIGGNFYGLSNSCPHQALAGIATRYEKRALNYRAVIVIAALMMWLATWTSIQTLAAQGPQNELGDEAQQNPGGYPPASPARRAELASRPEQLIDHVDNRTTSQGEEEN
jgi:hypothetical protein